MGQALGKKQGYGRERVPSGSGQSRPAFPRTWAKEIVCTWFQKALVYLFTSCPTQQGGPSAVSVVGAVTDAWEPALHPVPEMPRGSVAPPPRAPQRLVLQRHPLASLRQRPPGSGPAPAAPSRSLAPPSSCITCAQSPSSDSSLILTSQESCCISRMPVLAHADSGWGALPAQSGCLCLPFRTQGRVPKGSSLEGPRGLSVSLPPPSAPHPTGGNQMWKEAGVRSKLAPGSDWSPCVPEPAPQNQFSKMGRNGGC